VVTDELREAGVSVSLFDAREMTLAFPGFPRTDDSERLREAVEKADAMVLATPEYHGGFSSMTKLIIENLGFPSLLKNKPVGLLGVAAGRIGAIKSLEQLRGICSHTGALVLPGAVSIAGVQAAFDDGGNCTDADVEKSLRGLARSLLDFLDEFVSPKYTLEAMVRGEDRPWSAAV
jgi:NAD(P)H-dependent FMN reductase